VLGRHHQVGGQDELEAAAEREAVDRRDDRLAEVEELGQAAEPAGAVVGVDALPAGGRLQVPARAEESLPGPVRIAARSAGSPRSLSKARYRARLVGTSIALAFGRSRVTTSTGPSVRT